MKVTVSLAALIAVLLGSAGLVTVIIAAVIDARTLAWVGIAVLIVGCVAWVHHHMKQCIERLIAREDAAFQLGKMAGHASRGNLASVPQPREPQF